MLMGVPYHTVMMQSFDMADTPDLQPTSLGAQYGYSGSWTIEVTAT